MWQKFMLPDYTSDYKTRLKQLSILPFMYTYEIADIMFFVNSIKNPSPTFNILNYVDFLQTLQDLLTLKFTIRQPPPNSTMNSYFYHLSKLWNWLLIIDISRKLHEIKLKLKKYFWNHFIGNVDSNIPCTFQYLCPCTCCSKSPATCNYNYL